MCLHPKTPVIVTEGKKGRKESRTLPQTANQWQKNAAKSLNTTSNLKGIYKCFGFFVHQVLLKYYCLFKWHGLRNRTSIVCIASCRAIFYFANWAEKIGLTDLLQQWQHISVFYNCAFNKFPSLTVLISCYVYIRHFILKCLINLINKNDLPLILNKA